MHCFILFPFFLKYLPNAEYMISSRTVASESTLMIPNKFICVWNEPWERNVGKHFICSWQKRYAPKVITIWFITLLMYKYYDRLLPFFRQFLLIPISNNKFMDRTTNSSTPCHNQFLWVLTIPGDLWLLSFLIANSNSNSLGSGTSGSAVCISSCLTSLAPCTFNSWEK